MDSLNPGEEEEVEKNMNTSHFSEEYDTKEQPVLGLAQSVK